MLGACQLHQARKARISLKLLTKICAQAGCLTEGSSISRGRGEAPLAFARVTMRYLAHVAIGREQGEVSMT
jgi:hypothetical protein